MNIKKLRKKLAYDQFVLRKNQSLELIKEFYTRGKLVSFINMKLSKTSARKIVMLLAKNPLPHTWDVLILIYIHAIRNIFASQKFITNDR